MKWVKANERIPNDDGNRPVKVNGQYAFGNFFDLDEDKRAFSVNSSCDGYIVYPEYFNMLEWLDESNDAIMKHDLFPLEAQAKTNTNEPKPEQ